QVVQDTKASRNPRRPRSVGSQTVPGLRVHPPPLPLLAESWTGTGVLTVKVTAFEASPPGVRFTTITDAVPAWAMSSAARVTIRCVPLTNVVGRLARFHCTTESGRKFAPVSVRVTAGAPMSALDGAIALSVGTGKVRLITACTKFATLTVPMPVA